MANIAWDILGFGGLVMAGVGLWWLAPWLSLVCVGLVLLWFGIRGATG